MAKTKPELEHDEHDEHDELDELEGEPLPERAVMSAIMPPPPFLGADVDGGMELLGGSPSPVPPVDRIPETGV